MLATTDTAGDPESGDESALPLVTLSADSAPLSAVLRMLAMDTGVSLVAASALDSATVTLRLVDVPLDEALDVIARRLGAELTQFGGVYYLGTLRESDRGVLVRRVRRLTADEITSAVGVLITTTGKVQAYPDGLLVVGDHVPTLRRVSELLDQVESAPAEAWVVQLHLLTSRQSRSHDLGVDLTPAAQLSLAAATASGSGSTSQAMLRASLDGVLRAQLSTDTSRLLAQPAFLLSDGVPARLEDVTELRIPTRTTSPEGTVTESGYQVVTAGLTVEVQVRELGRDRARLSVEVDLGDVVAFLGEQQLPQIARQQFATQAAIVSGGVYLLGELQRSRSIQSVSGLLRSATSGEATTDTVQVWARAYRVRPPS